MDERFVPVPKEAEDSLPPESSVSGKLLRYLLRRLPVWPLIAFFAKKKVPQHRHSGWYTLGGIAMFFFVVQVVTGVLLMIYYNPGSPWQSVQRIVMEIPFGGLIRSIHHWSANLMILTLFLHMFSAFFMKAYRPPREFTWLTGLGLFGVTLTLGFSGYLLPWDDLSFFATRIGVSEMDKLPVLGPWMADLLRGGPDVTVETIGRFYPLHVVVLPLALMGILGLHLLLIQVQGVSEPDSFRVLPAEKKKYHKFFSEFMFAEIPIWLFMMGVLVLLSAMFPRGLMPEADPGSAAPEGIKPEWYFMVPFQMLKLFPGALEFVGMAVMGLLPLAFVAVPFIDRNVPEDARGRMVARAGIAMVILIVVFTVWGWLS